MFQIRFIYKFEYINVMVRISDLELLEALRDNSRTSFVKLAKKFGVTETAVRKRVKKLEDSGVIIRYTLDIDFRKLGMGMNALIGLDTAPESYIAVVDRLKRMKEVLRLRTSTGDHMLIVDGWFRDSDELTDFVKRLEKMEGVTRTCPAIITDCIK